MARTVVIDADGPRRSYGNSGSGLGLVGWILALFVLLLSARSLANFYIDLEWWKELGQGGTFNRMIQFAILPRIGAALVTALLFFGLSSRSQFSWRWRLLASLGAGWILASLFFNHLTFLRWYGGMGAAVSNDWRDPVFGLGLEFYFFSLPFYEMMLRWAMALLLIGGSYAILRNQFLPLRMQLEAMQGGTWDEIGTLDLRRIFSSFPVRTVVALALVLFAGLVYLGRYQFLYEEHGFLTGADYVAVNIGIPMVWLKVGATLAGAALVLLNRWLVAGVVMALIFISASIVPSAVNALRVRPNEITLQRPFIERHIQSTRAAYGLTDKLKERDFPARQNGVFEPAKHQELLENVRLWDWQAFHDTVTQIQALRPYYVFADTDVDRYRFADGRMRQVLLTPRELDVRQLPEARNSWINPHFIYTHGYGVVMAETSKISSDGLPVLLLKDAPLVGVEGAPKVTRPEIYYGEAVHEPVFVQTAQPEFNYPSGTENVHSKYEGGSGIPIKTFFTRLAAAVAEGDWNITLTSYLTPESRMLIRRNILNRARTLAEFVIWDQDPYLVVSKSGRLVWMLDGYTAHNRHPYARPIRTTFGTLNYMRNSVKATIDAYDGSTVLYAWDESDPVLGAYRNIYPELFQPASAMPPDLREHARYPETLFRVQAEMYLTYHMKDPEAFYNKEDLWDIAGGGSSNEGGKDISKPTYLMATLPGDKDASFILLTTFTPRNKQNLIGLMAARCDGGRLGEIEVLQLSKQQLIFGPNQVSARINQDQDIAKDLTLWNQQGSNVIRGQMLVLPMDNQFLYVQPIYLQAAKAPMPELRKVALAFGSRLAYADTYEQALSQLSGTRVDFTQEAPKVTSEGTRAPATPSTPAQGDARFSKAQEHFRRWRELSSQGKFSEAGREMEALEATLKP
ncbi:MAG: UPF0182 family protein [Bryobacter sp.]